MKIRDRKKDERILVLGHRGIPTKEIENTIASYDKALSYGADGVELDVHITRDDELVVSHDFSTKRVFGVDKIIEESTLAEIKEISKYIPTLEEVFNAIGPVIYDIEIKAEFSYNKKLISKLVDTLKSYPEFEDKLIISSFNPLAMRRFSKLSHHKYPQAIIYDRPPTSLPKLLQHGEGRHFFACDILKPKWNITTEEKEGKKNYPVIPWCIDSKENLDIAVKTNAPILITNDSETIIKALQEVGLR